MGSVKANLHVPLPAELHEKLRAEARKSGQPATEIARERRWGSALLLTDGASVIPEPVPPPERRRMRHPSFKPLDERTDKGATLEKSAAVPSRRC